MPRPFHGLLIVVLSFGWGAFADAAPPKHDHEHHHHAGGREFAPVEFSIRSVCDGAWSDARTWKPARVPKQGDLVHIARNTRVVYDVTNKDVIRLVQVVGKLSFARDRDTELNVGVLKVQNSDVCSETGFACDFHSVTPAGEPYAPPEGAMPVLEIGTPEAPIPAQYTARVRLHYIAGTNKDDAPALACCSARMDLHGAPLSRTWVELGATTQPGATQVELGEAVTGWKVGDEVLITGQEQISGLSNDYRYDEKKLGSETRRIKSIDGTTVTLDRALEKPHAGEGEFRCEVANLSRNVIIESADPDGVRGHTVYHQYSAGGISYARFAHLGKENVLGRYAIHFHLVGDTMRGSQVLGAAIVDSHNRWITVHGTEYLIVRDCVGYRSVGHGFYLEDGTEVYNVFDRNLGVQAMAGKRLPKQVLPFDPNDGAAFWWANGRNTFIRNTACENSRYGYRYDSQNRSNFNSTLSVRMPSGERVRTDIRRLPIYRFDGNESHSEGLYGVAVAGVDGVGPDTRHPHHLRNVKLWNVHYALRSQLPTMLIEDVAIRGAAYGVYRPYFENHVYRNMKIHEVSSEPFNRGLDDDSRQPGSISVDGLEFTAHRSSRMPFIQMSDNNPSGRAESHFRNVRVVDTEGRNRRPLVDRGGGRVVPPKTDTSVPVYLHDHLEVGRTIQIVSVAAKDFSRNDSSFAEIEGVTGRESRAKDVSGVKFPKLLDPIDDTPPATVIVWPHPGQQARLVDGQLIVRGCTTDNEATRRVVINGVEARSTDFNFHAWEVRLPNVSPGKLTITAYGEDEAGNVEATAHVVEITVDDAVK